MTGFKWTGILISSVTLALDLLANLLLETTTRYTVPLAVNFFAAIIVASFSGMAFSAYIQDRMNSKLDLVVDLLVTRFEELESTVGDRNSGFVEGYLLGHAPDASVVPLTPRIGRRGAGHA